MVYDRASGLNIPVFYVLSTSRSADAYWDMMHFVRQAIYQQLSPAEVVWDFEVALVEVVQTQFRGAIVLGCLFHLKQALRRVMKRYAIPDAECTIAMTRGVIDILTVANPDQVKSHGVAWAQIEIKQRCEKQRTAYSNAKW
ncbi:unnamed protein product [Phytophthora fragariaefolia]|uniref:Unnamed protein product n=1 Tax=Phytophthora fragariaefolia TaxID=1490495 RepID=A0A9W7D983_9STRA|nr:unnamed protein product [Phytophthora fragariaefolia]